MKARSPTLWAVALLPGRRGLARPAVGSARHDPASPLAGSGRPWSLAFAIPGLRALHLHLNKQSQRSGGMGQGKAPPFPSHTPLITLKTTLSIL